MKYWDLIIGTLGVIIGSCLIFPWPILTEDIPPFRPSILSGGWTVPILVLMIFCGFLFLRGAIRAIRELLSP